MSLEVDSPPSQLIAAHTHRLPVYAIGARSTGVGQEGQQFQNGAIRSSENKVTSLDHQTGGGCVFEGSVNDGSRETDLDQGNARRGHSVSPVPSLYRPRESTASYYSEDLRCGQTQAGRRQTSSRNPSSRTYGDAKDGGGSRNFRNYESPFTQRVREKLRRVHKSGEPNQETSELHASIEGPELTCKPETSTLTANRDSDPRERRLLPEEILESTSSSLPSASRVGGPEPVYTQ
ncbi:hypothetical protein EI94DRAFT_1747676 [Lactarius quietus]|nr:hypothetical protein EI94DRAFT_1747676 [Lactarius quietus]